MQKSATANIDSLKADLKSKKAEIKKLDKELAHLAEKKDEADKKAAIEANKKKAKEGTFAIRRRCFWLIEKYNFYIMM